jgi:hypothetical protein
MKACAMFAMTVSLCAGASEAQCLKYGPDAVELTGTVRLRTFYGPPGYGEDPTHDKREQQALLNLRGPVCIARGRNDGLEEPENGQRVVTLVPLSEGIDFRSLAGKHILVRGVLFHAISGHHHTPLLLQVQRLTDVKVQLQ